MINNDIRTCHNDNDEILDNESFKLYNNKQLYVLA